MTRLPIRDSDHVAYEGAIASSGTARRLRDHAVTRQGATGSVGTCFEKQKIQSQVRELAIDSSKTFPSRKGQFGIVPTPPRERPRFRPIGTYSLTPTQTLSTYAAIARPVVCAVPARAFVAATHSSAAYQYLWLSSILNTTPEGKVHSDINACQGISPQPTGRCKSP
jgi:hypothetical protein